MFGFPKWAADSPQNGNLHHLGFSLTLYWPMVARSLVRGFCTTELTADKRHSDTLLSKSGRGMSKKVAAHTEWDWYPITPLRRSTHQLLCRSRQLLIPDSPSAMPKAHTISTTLCQIPTSASSPAIDQTILSTPKQQWVLQAKEVHFTSY